MKYDHVTYGKGYTVIVEPQDRAADVMHNIITGGLLGGRSLEGVAVELDTSQPLSPILADVKEELALDSVTSTDDKGWIHKSGGHADSRGAF